MSANNKRYLNSGSACEWLCNLQLDNPEAKSVLQALILHADAVGVCFPSIGRLAKITDLHPDTVRRRLVALEEYALISRQPRWIDANGVRNGDRRGKQTSDKIRLLFPEALAAQDSADSDAICAAATSAENNTSHGVTEAVSQRAALAQGSQSSEGLITEQEKEREESPPTPPSGGVHDDSSWKAFAHVWSEPIAKRANAESIWLSLTPTERLTALKAAKGYRAWHGSQPRKRTPISAQTFLRDPEGWSQWMDHAPQAFKTGGSVIMLEGSDEWRAQVTIAKIAGRPRPLAVELLGVRGNRFPPLASECLDLGKYADDDFTGWEFLDQRDVRCIAWCNFLNIEARPIKFGTTEFQINGRTYHNWPVRRTGLRVPCPWPPGYAAEFAP